LLRASRLQRWSFVPLRRCTQRGDGGHSHADVCDYAA
jgi:hypothetical protein